jgi:hypothetical protein
MTVYARTHQLPGHFGWQAVLATILPRPRPEVKLLLHWLVTFWPLGASNAGLVDW